MKKILAIATAAMVACGSANAASIIGGDFETVASGSNSFQPVDSGSLSQIPGWVESTDDVIASASDTTIGASENSSSDRQFYGLPLDPASIAPIPEPTTWMMLLGGLGLVGFAMRGRKRQVTTFA